MRVDVPTPRPPRKPLLARLLRAGRWALLLAAIASAIGAAALLVVRAGPPATLEHEPVATDATTLARLTQLTFATAGDAAAAIRRGEVTSAQLTAHVLDRINRYNDRVNAIVTIDPQALEHARAADDAQARGVVLGPLHGVPVTVKDTFETRGLRTTAGGIPLPWVMGFPELNGAPPPWPAMLARPLATARVHALSAIGSAYLYLRRPSRDAVIVERLRRAGAVVVGKTNTPPMAGDMQTANWWYGVTRNPWDPTRTPGGSSGGAAAALATGMAYVEVGSDAGGSIRAPASHTGVYGHKPSVGLVAPAGHIPPMPGEPDGGPIWAFASPGPMARSAADLATALRLMVGAAPSHGDTLAPPRCPTLAGCRVAFVFDDPECPVVPEVREVLQHAVDALRVAGAQVATEGWPRGVVPLKAYSAFAWSLWRGVLGRPFPIERLRSTRRQLGRVFDTHDVLLLPTLFLPAFPHDATQPFGDRLLRTAAGQRSYFDLMYWVGIPTAAGLPVTDAPVGRTRDGLPVGMQIVGAYGEDLTTITFAEALAHEIGGFVPPPGY